MIFRLILLVTSLVFSDYLGGYSGSGFRYSANARDMSLGGSLMSEYNQGFNSFSNPALLSKVRNLEVGMSYFPMSLDRFVQTFSVSRSLSSLGGASLSVFNSGVSSIQGKDTVCLPESMPSNRRQPTWAASAANTKHKHTPCHNKTIQGQRLISKCPIKSRRTWHQANAQERTKMRSGRTPTLSGNTPTTGQVKQKSSAQAVFIFCLLGLNVMLLRA